MGRARSWKALPTEARAQAAQIAQDLRESGLVADRRVRLATYSRTFVSRNTKFIPLLLLKEIADKKFVESLSCLMYYKILHLLTHICACMHM